MELRVFVCGHVFDHSRPILLIANMDGDLCFLCGANHPDSESEYQAVGLNHILEMDPSVKPVIVKLKNNWEAERTTSATNWKYLKST
jgi:hypothetical protein